ncbi:hypothetical protein RB195_012781 [Necator americanus]
MATITFYSFTFTCVLLHPLLVSGKGLLLLEERGEQTIVHPLSGVATSVIEGHVLDILELEEPPPRVSILKRNDKIANFMAQLYHDLEQKDESFASNGLPNGEEWSSADRIVSFSPVETSFSKGILEAKFDGADLPSKKESHLVAAQLRIFLPKNIGFTKVSIYNNISGFLELVDSTIATSRDKTIGFNVTRIVSNWVDGLPERRIFIRLDEGIDSPHMFTGELESFIISFFVDGSFDVPNRRKRSRRAAEPVTGTVTIKKEEIVGRSSRGETEGCHVQSLYLNFADIGWREWVIAPEGYSANYCSGACSSDSPMHSKMNATNHAIVQTLVHLVDPKRADEAKCAPVHLSPAKILFIDNHGNVVMRRYQDMSVQECGCL